MVAAVPDGAGIDPIRSERHQIAQGTILDSLDRLNVARPMTALRASRDFEIFLFGFFGRGIDNTDSRTVHRDGFLHKNIFPGLNTGLEVRRPETWRSGQNAIVHPGQLERFLIRIEPAETSVLRDSKVLFAAGGLLRKHISYRHDFGIHIERLGRFKKILSGAAAAPAQANYYRIDRLLSLGPQHGREVRHGRRGSGRE